MKNITLLIACLFVVSAGSVAFSQEKKKEIRKEVRMEDENGKKVLTITTTEGDKITEEVFEGADAEKKLEEIQSKTTLEEERKEVQLEDHDGQKTLTITTSKNGEVSKEVYTGLDAEKKMKEMGLQEGQMIEVEKKIIKKHK